MEVNAVNPLLIPLVIKEVYKYLDFQDKKGFRLVCKLWIDTNLQPWRKETKLVIKHIEYNYELEKNLHPETADFILQYFNLYNIQDKTLRNLELRNVSFLFKDKTALKRNDQQITRIPQLKSVQKLLSTHFGHSLERLELVGCTFFETREFEVRLRPILFNYFPKLKVLSVRHPIVVPRPRFGKLALNKSVFQERQSNLITLNLEGKRCMTETVEMFNWIPNLKNLSLRRDACKFAKVLSSSLLHSGRYVSLERLCVDYGNDFQILMKIPTWLKNYVEAARPPLKCLKATLPFGMLPPLYLGWARFPQKPFLYKSIWSSVGNTLTTLNLRIWTERWSWCTLFTGCTLPKLTHLCLSFQDMNDEEGEADDLLKFDFGMLRGTPLLKKLHLEFQEMNKGRLPKIGTNLEGHELEWSGNAGSEMRGPIVLEHMEDFRFELYHKPTQGCWRAFAEMMPTLRKLQAILDEDTEPLMRELWPDLDLKWSGLLKQADDLMEDDDEYSDIVHFENEWDGKDWETG